MLVCKRWSALCLANPPQSRALAVRVEAASASYLSWVAKSSRHAESIRVDCPFGKTRLPKLVLSQTLTSLALSSPRLQTLTIEFPGFSPDDYFKSMMKRQGYDWDNCAGCLHLFPRLETLCLRDVRFLTDESLANEDPDWEDEDNSVPLDYFEGMTLNVCHVTSVWVGIIPAVRESPPQTCPPHQHWGHPQLF